MGYVELHCHSAFSFLDGASTPAELAATAAEHGYPAMAITDHDGLWGAVEFAQAGRGLGGRGSGWAVGGDGVRARMQGIRGAADHRGGDDRGGSVGRRRVPPHAA